MTQPQQINPEGDDARLSGLLSPLWYRVADLKPRLRSHAVLIRHRFRGTIWFVLQDNASGRFHRFTQAAYLCIGQMDGTRSVNEIWLSLAEELGDDLPSQDEIVRLLSQLYSSDVLSIEQAGNLEDLDERGRRVRRLSLMARIKNPLAIRIPVIDPDRFLAATLPLVRPFLGWFGFILWLLIIVWATLMAGENWKPLTENITDRILASQNLAYLFISYPIVKALHELGHGYAAKVRGGEIHEMGIMFLIFMPVPYVEASSATAFRNKWNRAAVGAAGIMVELLLAAGALLVWLNVEPGVVKVLAFNVMLIGGVSTILFNGNPLLRFDGYYVLVDLVEIPNLGPRSSRYLYYLAQRYLFGVKAAVSPVAVPSERRWLLGYGIASAGYRLLILTAIVWFVAGKFFVIGVVMAIWAAFLMFGMPLFKAVKFLIFSPILNGKRGRAAGVCGAMLAFVLAFFLALPVPHGSVAEGIIAAPERARIFASADGVVAEVLAIPGSNVEPGMPLIRIEDPLIAARVRLLKGELQEAVMRYRMAFANDRTEAAVMLEQIGHVQRKLEHESQRAADLVLKSPARGKFLISAPADLPGMYIHKGEMVAYVMAPSSTFVHVVVEQDQIDDVRLNTQFVAVRLASAQSQQVPAKIVREVPAATQNLPSLALAVQGGGRISTNPVNPAEPGRALEPFFQFELQLTEAGPSDIIGERVFVRFDHGASPLAPRLFRAMRRLFLSKFDV